MNPNTQKLHDPGQRLWLNNIMRELLTSGTLARYISELSVAGLTSNQTIIEQAISKSTVYDQTIQKLAAQGFTDEGIFFEVALQDLTLAAQLQDEGLQAFAKSWSTPMVRIREKSSPAEVADSI